LRRQEHSVVIAAVFTAADGGERGRAQGNASSHPSFGDPGARWPALSRGLPESGELISRAWPQDVRATEGPLHGGGGPPTPVCERAASSRRDGRAPDSGSSPAPR